MTDTFQLTPHETIRLRSHTPEAVEVEGTWEPGALPPLKHFHPEQDELFEVLAGALSVKVDGVERTYGAGEGFEIPRGAVHQMWNPGEEPARAIWRTSPAGRTLDWYADLDALRRAGRVGKNGMPGPLAFGVYLTEYRDVFRLAGPQPILRAALGAMGALGRLRGYRSGLYTGATRNSVSPSGSSNEAIRMPRSSTVVGSPPNTTPRPRSSA